MIKKLTKRILLQSLAFIVTGHLLSFSQVSKVDSLKQVIESTNYNTAKARAIKKLGSIYRDLGKYEKAIKYYNQAYSIYEKAGNQNSAAVMLRSIGRTYYTQGDYPAALQYYLQALGIYENNKIENSDLGYLLHYIGSVFKRQKNNVKASEFYRKELALANKLNNDDLKAEALYLLAGMENDEKKALALEIESFNIYKKNNDKSGLAVVSINIGWSYLNFGNYDKALEYLLLGLQYDKELKDTSGIVIDMCSIAELYIDKKEYRIALRYLNEAELYLPSVHLKRHLRYQYYYKISYRAYKGLADYKNALKFHLLYFSIKDSILNEESMKQVAEMQTKYETEKKEQKIELLNKDKTLQTAELNKQKIIIWSGAGGLLLALSLAFFIYRGYRQKQKANLQLKRKNTTITRQKEEIETKNKDITDSILYAQSIQQAILPNEAEMSKALPEYFVYFAPRDIVSGDFYWFHSMVGEDSPPEAPRLSGGRNQPLTKGGTVIIAAVDCTGHGVPGAFVSMIGNDLLNQIVIEKNVNDPGEILSLLNRGIKSVFTRKGGDLEAKDGMDIAIVTLKFITHGVKLGFAGANNPLILIQNGELSVIKGDRTPIGGITELDYNFTNHKIELQKGDIIYIFSDGYQDQFGGSKGKKFMIKRFKQHLLSIHEKPMAEQREILSSAINDWKGDVEQVDDILVIGVRV